MGQKLGDAESCNLVTNSFKFPTDDSAPNKFSQNGGFYIAAANLVYLNQKIFRQEKCFYDRQKFRVGSNYLVLQLPLPPPRHHCLVHVLCVRSCIRPRSDS